MRNMGLWRPLAVTLALVIGVYLVGHWIPVPGVALGEIVDMCQQRSWSWHWHLWTRCPDRAPQTTELAGVAMALAVVAWVALLIVKRVIRAMTTAN